LDITPTLVLCNYDYVVLLDRLPLEIQMFDNSGYMVGMHGFWWMFWLLFVGGLMFFGWGNPSVRSNRLRESPHEMLRRRLAKGELTPTQYEEHKALLDRDGDQPSHGDQLGSETRSSSKSE
jgi:putative membrane protein